jgi:hypothetical protein
MGAMLPFEHPEVSKRRTGILYPESRAQLLSAGHLCVGISSRKKKQGYPHHTQSNNGVNKDPLVVVRRTTWSVWGFEFDTTAHACMSAEIRKRVVPKKENSSNPPTGAKRRSRKRNERQGKNARHGLPVKPILVEKGPLTVSPSPSIGL